MERRSVQHGRRLDDAMADEVAPLTHGAPLESRAREDLEAEPAADAEPVPDAVIHAPDDGSSIRLSHDELEARSELARHLRPSAFPIDRGGLIVVAIEELAPESIIEALQTLPMGVEFLNVSQVWNALGGHTEHREAVTPEPAPAAALALEPRKAVKRAVKRAAPKAAPAPAADARSAPTLDPVALLTMPVRIASGVLHAAVDVATTIGSKILGGLSRSGS